MDSNLYLRAALSSDTGEILEIYESGIAFLRENGVDQWQDMRPGLDTISQDLATGSLYVLVDKGTEALVGAFSLIFGDDPTYSAIYEGQWASGLPYATIHRFAVASGLKGKGYAQDMFSHCEDIANGMGISQLRVDTHEDNAAMAKAILKAGFERRGHIFIANGAKRIAYDKQV